MLIIRLTRKGKKNRVIFRLVLTKKEASPQSGRFLELLGHYHPHLKQISLKKERIKHWLKQGVQTSETVHNLLVQEGIIKGPKIKKKIKSKKKKKEVDKSAEESKIEKE